MAYPKLRSMNQDLIQGATDGKYKKIRPDSGGATIQDDMTTYDTRKYLNLPYYGVGEARTMEVPGTNRIELKPDFHPNKFEQVEEGPTFGKTW